MKTLAKVLLATALIGGFSQLAEAGSKKLSVTGEAGFVGNGVTVGASVKRGKYTGDVHVGTGKKKVISIGIYRDVLTLDNIKLGVGLSANQIKSQKGKILKTTTYQGYDVQLEYGFGKYKVRGTVNSNGDVKAGFGFSF